MGRLEPLDNEPAPTLIRRLVCSIDFGLDSATYPIALCPYWLRKLQWREDAPGVYIDASGAVVARIVWWRDAGPVDIDDESIWGEGCYVALTQRSEEHTSELQSLLRTSSAVFCLQQQQHHR